MSVMAGSLSTLHLSAEIIRHVMASGLKEELAQSSIEAGEDDWSRVSVGPDLIRRPKETGGESSAFLQLDSADWGTYLS